MAASSTRPATGRPAEPASKSRLATMFSACRKGRRSPFCRTWKPPGPPSSMPKSLAFNSEAIGSGRNNSRRSCTRGKALKIEDEPRPVGDQDLFAMQRTLVFTTETPPANVWLRAVTSRQDRTARGRHLSRSMTVGSLRVAAHGKAVVRQQQRRRELIVPVAFDDGKAKIELKYDW